jgi:hypothetical protein
VEQAMWLVRAIVLIAALIDRSLFCAPSADTGA